MSDVGGMVAQLIAAGTPPELAARVVAEAFVAGVASVPVRVTSADESVTRRRENDRLRQQRRRDNLRTSADSRDNPQMSQNASLYKKESKEVSKRETTRGSRLPNDWRPSPQNWAIAYEQIGEQRSQAELEKFQDHWKTQPGSKGVKLDWNAAWRNWIRRTAEYAATSRGPQRIRPQGFETLIFQQPESPPDEPNCRSGYDLDLTANPAD